MHSYHDLLRRVRDNGTRKPTRAILASTGERVHAISVFGAQWRHDLRAGFPALTTKRIAFKAVAVELAWFLRGDTTIDFLRAHGVTIWDEWATPAKTALFGRVAGDLGPIYGKQWRSFAGADGETTDQIATLLCDIEAVKLDPFASCARRLIVSAWHPGEATKVALPPCHTLFQFGVTNGALSCHLFMRSADLFLGVPFNIASYALLTHVLAAVTGLDVGDLVVSYSDLHIYENHLAQVEEQLRREPKPLPRLDFGKQIRAIGDFDPLFANLVNYQHHPAIKAEVAV